MDTTTDERWRTADDLGPGTRSHPVPAAAPGPGPGVSRVAAWLRVSAVATGLAVTAWLVRRRRANGGAGRD